MNISTMKMKRKNYTTIFLARNVGIKNNHPIPPPQSTHWGETIGGFYRLNFKNMEQEKYHIVEGTYYQKDTPKQVIDICEESRISTCRLKFFYGDIKTGKLWGDVETGHVGRSIGQIKIPLLIKNKRSLSGESLLDNCIVKIEHANKKNGTQPLFDITKK